MKIIKLHWKIILNIFIEKKGDLHNSVIEIYGWNMHIKWLVFKDQIKVEKLPISKDSEILSSQEDTINTKIQFRKPSRFLNRIG